MGCFLCVASDPGEGTPWFDRPLSHRRGVGTVLPGLGALTADYVLVSPERHVPCILALETARRRAFGDYVCGVLEAYRKAVGPFIFWEHGGDSAGTARTSACVDHAHLHVTAGAFELGMEIVGKRQFSDIRSWLDQPDQVSGEPYLLFGMSESPCWAAPDIGISQYFRRELACVVGRKDQWDYAAVPNYGAARSTVERLPSLLHEV